MATPDFGPVLADRGLDGALKALALVNPIPTTVVTRLPGRLPAPVESAAYFAVTEALSNAIKHAWPEHIRITVEFVPRQGGTAGELAMRVSDDGRGGSSPTWRASAVFDYGCAGLEWFERIVALPTGDER